MFRSDAPWARFAQVAVSLLVGLTIWEIAGWQFTNAYLAPVFGTDFPPTHWLGSMLAALFGAGPVGDHPGTIPRLFDFIRDGEFFDALGQSLSIFLTGFGIAVAIGLPVGVVLARLPLLRTALEGYVLALYATPMAALIPFILSIFGYQFWPKVYVVILFSVFPILYNTLEGARSLKPELVEVAKSFRSSEARLWIDILIPYTLPFALTGIRQSIGRALVGMVAAEILLNPTGLGGWLADSSRSFDTAGVLGAILVITLLGVFLMNLVQRLETRFAAWRGTNR